MAGHQPELFHPGVWVKNFALTGVAGRIGAIPFNLVVDNDAVKSTSIHFPAPSARALPRVGAVRLPGRRRAL